MNKRKEDKAAVPADFFPSLKEIGQKEMTGEEILAHIKVMSMVLEAKGKAG